MTRQAGGQARPIIECADLSKTYDLGAEQVHALRGVTFTITRGEFVAVMGASGSGNSTLANLLGALDKPNSGELVIDGEAVAGMSGDARALAQPGHPALCSSSSICCHG